MRKIYFLFIFFLIYFISYSAEFSHIITFEGHKSSIGCLAFSSNSKYLASGSFDTTIKIWNLNRKKLENTIKHGAIVEAIAFSKDNDLLVSAGRDKYIKLWNVKTGDLILTYGPLNDFIFCVEFTPDNKKILIGSYRYIYFFDIKKNKITYKLDAGYIWVKCLKFSTNNNYLGICGGNEAIIYNFKSDTNFINKIFGKDIEIKKIASYKTSSYIYSIDFSNDSQYFAFGNENGEIYLYRIIDGLLLLNKKIFNSLIWSMVFINNKHIAVAGRDKDIVIFDIKNGNIINILPTLTNENFSIAFSGNGKYLASSGKNAKIFIWEIQNTENLVTFRIIYFIIIILFFIIIINIIIFKIIHKKKSVKDWEL